MNDDVNNIFMAMRNLSVVKCDNVDFFQFDFSIIEALPEITYKLSSCLRKSQRADFIELMVKIYSQAYKHVYRFKKKTNLLFNLLEKDLGNYFGFFSFDDLEALDSLTPNELKVLMGLALASSSFDSYKIIVRYIADNRLNQFYNETKQRTPILNLLNEGKVLEYAEKSKSFKFYHQDVARLIEGKSVAIVGPVENGLNNGTDIDSFDYVFRFNFKGSVESVECFGSRTDGSFYILKDFSELKDPDQVLSQLQIYFYHGSDLKHLSQANIEKGFYRFQPNNFSHPLLWGAGNAVQKAIYNLLMYQPARIKIFNSNLWVDNKFSKDYKASRANRNRKTFLRQFVWHDPVGNFLFTKKIFDLNLFEADEQLTDVLNLSVLEYLEALERSLAL